MNAIFLILAMMAPPASQGKVTSLLRDNIGLYDSSGALIRKVPKQSAPKLPLDVVARSPTGQLGVNWEGQVVYLRNSEVIAKGLPDECANSAPGRNGGRAIAASEGIGSGMGNRSTPCVR
jgi:hypothetical protein